MNILILSRSENVHADRFEKYCEKEAHVDRINFDFDTCLPGQFPVIACGEETLLRSYDAFFVHHPRVSYKDAWFVDEIERKLFVASWESVKEWIEAQFPTALWANRPSANVLSKNILRQLNLASKLGFKVPETIFTNQLDELRRFAGSGAVIIKQGNLGVNIEGRRILTSLIDLNAINQEMLRGCPCLFQKYVPKEFELRIHVIGNKVLACKINSQASKRTEIDWRNYDLENTPHESYELNDAIRNKCVEFVREINLAFGIIDVIVTPSGDCVFLECNAQGHWIWIEELTGLPITKTLCDYILSYGSD